ncbi:hypothetical protein EDB86DRAFT_2333938 [Lactarius hatsudake]|nr:hypothetical protein EDB86DRAFT_2333938 [Lactarius hatsudake]
MTCSVAIHRQPIVCWQWPVLCLHEAAPMERRASSFNIDRQWERDLIRFRRVLIRNVNLPDTHTGNNSELIGPGVPVIRSDSVSQMWYSLMSVSQIKLNKDLKSCRTITMTDPDTRIFTAISFDGQERMRITITASPRSLPWVVTAYCNAFYYFSSHFSIVLRYSLSRDSLQVGACRTGYCG